MATIADDDDRINASLLERDATGVGCKAPAGDSGGCAERESAGSAPQAVVLKVRMERRLPSPPQLVRVRVERRPPLPPQQVRVIVEKRPALPPQQVEVLVVKSIEPRPVQGHDVTSGDSWGSATKEGAGSTVSSRRGQP